MSRSRAALIHLIPTILVLAVLAAIVVFSWYPYPFWQFGKSGLFALSLILVAALAGPFLTWVVYRAGKRGLLFDLCFIAIIQLAAIAWGTTSLYQSRPFWMVYTLDRFEVLSMRDIDPAWVTDQKFFDRPFAAPQLLVANMPTDPAVFQNLVREVMFEGKPDLQFRPEYWSLYSEKKEVTLQKSRPLIQLRDARPNYFDLINRLVKNNGGDISRLKFTPVHQKDGHFTAILDGQSGDVVKTLMIDPYIDE